MKKLVFEKNGNLRIVKPSEKMLELAKRIILLEEKDKDVTKQYIKFDKLFGKEIGKTNFPGEDVSISLSEAISDYQMEAVEGENIIMADSCSACSHRSTELILTIKQE